MTEPKQGRFTIKGFLLMGNYTYPPHGRKKFQS